MILVTLTQFFDHLSWSELSLIIISITVESKKIFSCMLRNSTLCFLMLMCYFCTITPVQMRSLFYHCPWPPIRDCGSHVSVLYTVWLGSISDGSDVRIIGCISNSNHDLSSEMLCIIHHLNKWSKIPLNSWYWFC